MELLTGEEMLLLALDNEKGGTTWLSGWTALVGAALVDALAAGALSVEDDHLRPGAEVEHPLLRRVRAAVAAQDKPLTLSEWLHRLPRDLDPFLETVAARLVDSGVLAERRTKILGLFGTIRFPEADPAPERALRARLRSVLVDGAVPDDHDLLLIALVQPAGLLAAITEDDDRDVRKAARRRAAELTEQATARTNDGGTDDAVQAVATVQRSAAVTAMMGSIAATTAATAATVTTTN